MSDQLQRRSQLNRADLIRMAAGGVLDTKTAELMGYQPVGEDTSALRSSFIGGLFEKAKVLDVAPATSRTEGDTSPERLRTHVNSQYSADKARDDGENQSSAVSTITATPAKAEMRAKEKAERTTVSNSSMAEQRANDQIMNEIGVESQVVGWVLETSLAEQSPAGTLTAVRSRSNQTDGISQTDSVVDLLWYTSSLSPIESMSEYHTKAYLRQRRQSYPRDPSGAEGHPPVLLGSFSALLPGLRRAATQWRAVGATNLRVVQKKAECAEAVDRIPKVKRRRWGTELCIVFDSSERLIPYRNDYAAVCAALERLIPWRGMRRCFWRGDRATPIPPAGTTVIALTDLGSLASTDNDHIRLWLSYGQKVQYARCKAVALLPGLSLHGGERLARYWQTISWRHLGEPLENRRRLELLDSLLVLAAPASRVEPGLLRQLRRLLGSDADSGLEAAFWQAPELLSAHPTAATMRPEERNRRRQAFANLDSELRREVLKLIHRWREAYRIEPVFAGEAKQLDAESQELISREVRSSIVKYFGQLAARVDAGTATVGELAWCWELTENLNAVAAWSSIKNPVERRALESLFRATHHERSEDPQHYTEPKRPFVIWQHGNQLQVKPEGVAVTSASKIGVIASRGSECVLEKFDDFWNSNVPPKFVEYCGTDTSGRWLIFSLTGLHGTVRQRMRWIPPGRFLMGGVIGDLWLSDAPQHEVMISDGFWLFDTPCTQALWTAVMGGNPSQFESPNQPVENVSWYDVKDFIARINEAIPDLNLSLPSEAQWEYACRAGTTTAASFDAITAVQVDAGYGDHRRGTVPVRSGLANAWGLYEMLGNVWQWCEDGPRLYKDGLEIDPVGPLDIGSRRVLRGGSWDSSRFVVRASHRESNHPSYNDWGIGFRCARVRFGAEPGDTCRIRHPFVIRSDCERVSVAPLVRPSWATTFGRDGFGVWATFQFESRMDVTTQKMRWINPGRFIMGGAENEDEAPQHEVMISNGFWLFDTPCTQALWTAVMGSNPSQFESPNQPVENVSWCDVKDFIARIDEAIPDLNLSLPSEAQWEYACRAGITTVASFDEITTVQVNGGYGDPRRGTVPVLSGPVNAWGLYEMLGNVWQWCEDGPRLYKDGPEIDPVGPLDIGARRVLRGGSWRSPTKVRSAARHSENQKYRASDIGFRCARPE